MSAICSGALMAAMLAAPALAQSAPKRYPISIGSVPLAEGLRYIQRETGARIAFSPDQVGERSSRAVAGNLTAEEAIKELLEGTGLILKSDGEQLFVVIAMQSSAAAAPSALYSTAAAVGPSVPPQLAQSAVPVEQDVEEVIVTGSRLTTGFETATPVTAITADNLLATAPSNIGDALKQLPALAASALGSTTSAGTVGGANGQSLMNLRALGANRTLVLLSGRRVIATNQDNSVDLNVMPQNLISRVDVVTGGASAAYGSDAVAGVINLVLDTDFVGVKGELGTGISTYGDLPSYKGSLAWGGTFANDRLHVLASTQYFRQEGTSALEDTGREWFEKPVGVIPNTTGSGPSNLVVTDVRSSVASDGGVINNTILKGTMFLSGGIPARFNYGFSPGPAFQGGGDGHSLNFNFATDQWRWANFAHASYDLNDSAELYVEAGYSRAVVMDDANYITESGAQFQYTIFSGNPFIPASIQNIMTANNIQSFTFGRFLREFPVAQVYGNTRVFRQAVGIKGRELFGDWNYDVSYSHGRLRQWLGQNNTPKSREMYAAADAVVHPGTGQVVCRSQYYDGNTFVPGGTGRDPGCKPINLFGAGSVAPEAMGWTIGEYWKDLTLTQNVVAASISGDLGDRFALDAGPISVATGLEYRTEKAVQTSDPISQQRIDFTGIRGGPAPLNNRLGPYRYGNPQPFTGDYDVKEGFIEIGIPLVRDTAWAVSLNVDGAVRYTDYSSSGGVTTWKAGFDWQMIDDLRFRGTVSRDIRAPNLRELYDGATQGGSNLLYPSSSNGTTVTGLTTTSGNPNLVPERALTQTYGAVFTPSFFEGFNLSVDYYAIKINGAISTVSNQQTIDNCYAGIQLFCDNVRLVSGALFVQTPFLNLNELQNAGFDIEASYKTELLGNPLSISVLATRLTKSSSQAPGAVQLVTLGDPRSPKWRANLQIHYDINDFNIFLQQRYIDRALADATKIEGVFVDNNQVKSVTYTDMTLTYHLDAWDASNDLYFTVSNLWNTDPPRVPVPPTNFIRPTDRAVYEALGRFFNLGVRFKF
jgi:outer membrane receptor protein involved in Fe transport